MPDVRILRDEPDFQAMWGEYVLFHPDATLDHCWEWRWVLEQAFGFRPYYLGAFGSGRLTGILPLFCVPRGFGRSALVSIPFGNYGGICADTPDSSAALLEEAQRLTKKLGCEHMALLHKKPIDAAQLQAVNDRSQYSMPVTGSPEKLFAGLTTNLRNKIRYGAKHGIVIRASRDTGPLYQIHVDKFRRLGTPCFPRAYFDLTLKYFGERVVIKYADYKERAVAFELVHFFRSSVLVTLAGDLAGYLKLNPNVCLAWDLIESAAKLGYAEVDMCRSKPESGVANYKKYLGMQEHSLGYQYYVPDGRKLARRDHGDAKFQTAIRLWRAMPLGCTRVLGPKIVRYLA